MLTEISISHLLFPVSPRIFSPRGLDKHEVKLNPQYGNPMITPIRKTNSVENLAISFELAGKPPFYDVFSMSDEDIFKNFCSIFAEIKRNNTSSIPGDDVIVLSTPKDGLFLCLENSRIVIYCSKFDTWPSTFEVICKISLLLNNFFNNVLIEGMRFELTNSFNIKEIDQNTKYDLFISASDYLPSIFFTDKLFKYKFSTRTDAVFQNCELISTIGISIEEEKHNKNFSHVAKIVHLQSVIFASNINSKLGILLCEASSFDFAQLFKNNRDFLKNILNIEIAKKIGLHHE